MSRLGLPLLPRPDQRVTVTSSTSLRVTWGVGTMEGVRDVTYRVLAASTKDPGSSLHCRRSEDKPNSCQLTNLTPQTQYNITVVGCLGEGVCGPPSSLLVSTPLSGASPFAILVIVFGLFVFLACVVGNLDVLMVMLRSSFKGQSKQSMKPARELQEEGIALTRINEERVSYDNPCIASVLAEEPTYMTSQSAYPTNDTNPQVNETTTTAYGANHVTNESAFPVYGASPIVFGTPPTTSRASTTMYGASSTMSEAFPIVFGMPPTTSGKSPSTSEASLTVSRTSPATSGESPTMNGASSITPKASRTVYEMPPTTSGESPTMSEAPLLNESNSLGNTITPRPTENDDPPTYHMVTGSRSSRCTGSIQVEIHRVEEK